MRCHTLVVALVLGCGPKVAEDPTSDDHQDPEQSDEQPCMPCLQLACKTQLDACASTEACECTAECLEGVDDDPAEDPVFVCADQCNRLDDPGWRELSLCAAEACDMCPASHAK
jgi:hypothetical protein